MSFSNTAETSIMSLIFQATAWAGIADNADNAPLTELAVALHTADPGEAGTLAASETTYTGYARAIVPRSSEGWTVAGGVVSPAENIDFAAGTGGGGTITHFSVGVPGAGAAPMIMKGTVAPNIAAGNGVTPRLTTSTTLTLD